MLPHFISSAIPAEFQADSWSMFGALILLCLLGVKELISQRQDARAARLKVLLNIAIVPLLLAFLWMVISNAVNVLK